MTLNPETLQYLNASGNSETFQSDRSTEAVSQKCTVKTVFLNISQNSQENTCVKESFL